jgi:Flp pilus assembly CpaE family ATPase
VRIATVLSARPWEADLVTHAHTTARARVVLRAFEADDVDMAAHDIDVVVVGAETAWLTPARIRSWRNAGLRVVGIHAREDRPAAERLRIGGADEIVADDTFPSSLLHLAQLLAAVPTERAPAGSAIAIVGALGAPGVTEVAVSLAWTLAAPTPLLLDLDPAAPSTAIRLRIPPHPDVRDLTDRIGRTGTWPADAGHLVGPLRAVPGCQRPPALSPAATADLVDAARGAHRWVVVDAGGIKPDGPLLVRADAAVLVVQGTPRGLVRAARYVERWAGPVPALVLNRVPAGSIDDVAAAVRRWIGLEPAAVVADDPRIDAKARRGEAPHPRMRLELGRIPLPEPRRGVVASKG